MDNENKRNWTTGEATQLMRIADALEEVLRLVKLDQEASKKRWEYKPEEKDSE
jgi:hypothetical protein